MDGSSLIPFFFLCWDHNNRIGNDLAILNLFYLSLCVVTFLIFEVFEKFEGLEKNINIDVKKKCQAYYETKLFKIDMRHFYK